jgi:Rieske Fe-S protein
VTSTARRRWLAGAGAASLALGLSRCSDGPGAVVTVDVGALDAWRERRWRLFEPSRVIMARDADGLFAMSATCPHQGCVVSPNPGAVCLPPEDGATSTTPTLCCACHGSAFDGQGVAMSGPAAPQSLVHWRVVVVDGRVQVLVGERVSANVRAAE